MSSSTDHPSHIPVYTCIVGDYDYLLPAPTGDPRLRFVCFTDRPTRRVRGWEMRPLAWMDPGGNDTLTNRYHKFFAHRLFPDEPWTVYHDGNIRVVGPVSDLVDRCVEDGSAIGLLQHIHRTTLEEEYHACLRLNKLPGGLSGIARRQLDEYRRDGYADQVPLSMNFFMIRNNQPVVARLMEQWWGQLSRWAPRDQLSLPYLLWKTQTPYTILDVDVRSGGYVFRDRHRETGLRGVLQRWSAPDRPLTAAVINGVRAAKKRIRDGVGRHGGRS